MITWVNNDQNTSIRSEFTERHMQINVYAPYSWQKSCKIEKFYLSAYCLNGYTNINVSEFRYALFTRNKWGLVYFIKRSYPEAILPTWVKEAVGCK